MRIADPEVIMKIIEGKHARLEVADLIRVNQLVREKTDYEGFLAWYENLSLLERIALMRALNDFAGQALFPKPPPYEEALADAGLSAQNPLVERAKLFRTGLSLELRMLLDDWLLQLTDEERLVVFRFFVYLFGTAERKVKCGGDCNHWWHRDLMDARVVDDLLQNPSFYYTNPRDDERVKKQ